MKTILCYGDSNTHGANPTGGPRFDPDTRWPGVLRGLGAAFRRIASEKNCAFLDAGKIIASSPLDAIHLAAEAHAKLAAAVATTVRELLEIS